MNEKEKKQMPNIHLSGLLDSVTVAVQDYCKENKLAVEQAHEAIREANEKERLQIAAVHAYLNHVNYRKVMGNKD